MIHRRGPGPLQQRRSETTRRAVIRATVSLLRQGGVEAATAAAISKRSGVSWGGIQHQFGTKDAVLDATLDWLITDLAAEWRTPETASAALEDRVEAFVALVWRVVHHPSYRPLMELLRLRASRNAAVPDRALAALRTGAAQTLRSLFSDLELDEPTLDAVDAFCFAAVGGIADHQGLSPLDGVSAERSLALVTEGILAALRRAR